MASEIKVDTISEKTSANGITIDGVNIKDSQVPAAAGSSLVYLTQSSGTNVSSIALTNIMADTSYKYYIMKGSFQPIDNSTHIYMRWLI